MKSLILFFIFLFPFWAQANCTIAVSIDGAITVGTADYLRTAQSEALRKNCSSIFVRMNTPGGEYQASRLIVERILNSPVPYLCLITPSGAHAGSAGAIILQACHVAAGLPATNVGAATPILGSGQNIGGDLRKKMINDSVSWTESLATLRHRNPTFAKEIITEAKSLSSEEAVKIKALDFLAPSETDFLEKASGRKVQIQNQADQAVQVGPLIEYEKTFRHRLLEFISDPEFAYLLFMVSLGLLYFEITHTGLFAPGVAGAVGIILSLVAFDKLEVRWGGFALMILGIAFLVAEIFVPSFGALGVGGVVALVFGSLILYDPQTIGYTLPLRLVSLVSLLLGTFFVGIGFLALKTHRRKPSGWSHELEGKTAKVVSLENSRSGQVEVLGEIWKFESAEDVDVGSAVRIRSRDGIVLKVHKI